MQKHTQNVSKEYSKAIEDGAKSIVANTGKGKFAGYEQSDVDQVSEDMMQYSFGCGNPLAFSQVQPGQTVLDLGCGAGLDLLLAAQKVGKDGRVIGVDINEDMLALAAKNCQERPQIELRQGVIENLPVESNSIDWVISNCVINLSEDKQSAFNEIARVLKPGGKMLVSDIVGENIPAWARYSGAVKAACAGGVISESQYLEGLEKAGLTGGNVLARQYYDANQIAMIVSDAAPAFLSKLRCCGNNILHSLLTKIVRPVAQNIWSAKISASLAQP